MRLLALTLLAACLGTARADFDIIIAGGRIVDGTGAPWYVADVGIQDGRIANIGRLAKEKAARRIAAEGMIVAPGFIDMMGQTVSPLIDEPEAALNLLTQGITTVNAGEGSSAAPIDGEAARREGWRSMAEYFHVVELAGLPLNLAQTVGHTQVRRLVMGEVDRKPTADELARMKDMVREAMEAGAIGVSTALIYPPAVSADTDEIGALAAVAGEYGGRYFTHMRNEGDQLLEALDAALEIGRKGRTPVHIFHLKTAGGGNWPKREQAVAKIRAARAAGVEVMADFCSGLNNGESPIPLEQAVARASALAANEIMARDRGRIAEGLAADVIVFEDQKPAEDAVWHPAGMKQVIVNGQVVLDGGKLTKARPGRVLRGPCWRREVANTGDAVPELAAVDTLMQNFLAEHSITGASLAITDGGRLVYARGFGYGDVAAREKVTAESLFRIASISKPITAKTIFCLLEEGKLTLDSKVFELLDKFEPPDKDAKVDERLAGITIRQLLQHSGGWDRDKSFDAMFRSVDFARSLKTPPPAGPNEVIRNMMAQPLDFDPGARQSYSNYGYCLLGRVIEKLTGQSYEIAVRERLLDPSGARTMTLGRSMPEQRKAGEVRYYTDQRGPSVFADTLGQRVPYPYGGWNLEAMDSHGAWLASCVDLVRFAVSFDDNGDGTLLKRETLDAMFARPPGKAALDDKGQPKDFSYAAGWGRRETPAGPEFAHSGALSGTATILVKRPDGRNWTVLFNTRGGPRADYFPTALKPELTRILDSIAKWPAHDLFAKFPKNQPVPLPRAPEEKPAQ